VKVLLACDGTQDPDKTVGDLPQAGLPADGRALILCMGESISTRSSEGVRKKIQPQLSRWELACEVLKGAWPDALLQASRLWQPDLLILGCCSDSERRTMDMRRVSLDLVRQAGCSVRVIRARDSSQGVPIRLLVGNDGSKSTAAIVDALSQRDWPAGTQVRIISVVESLLDLAESSLVEILDAAMDRLRVKGLHVETAAVTGDPRQVLAREAERFNADTIFVAPHQPLGLSRFLMGSVATAAWIHARCAVEVVR